MSTLVQYQNDIIIDEVTKEAYTSQSGAARICFGNARKENMIRSFLSSQEIELEMVEILTPNGIRSSRKVTEDILMKLIAEYNPSLLPDLARAGLRAYLYTLAGYKFNAIKQAEETQELKSLVLKLFDKLESIEQISKDYEDIRAKTAANMIGADQLIEELKKQDPSALPEDGISIAAWLKRKGVTLDKSRFHRLASIASHTYRSLVHQEPCVGQCEVDGKMMYGVAIYRPIHFPILQIALNKLMSEL